MTMKPPMDAKPEPLTADQIAALFDVPVAALAITPEESSFIAHREQMQRDIAEMLSIAEADFDKQIR